MFSVVCFTAIRNRKEYDEPHVTESIPLNKTFPKTSKCVHSFQLQAFSF